MIELPVYGGKPLEKLDDDFITGLGDNYQEGYVYGDINRCGKAILIVGEIMEWDGEGIIHEYWVQVDPESVELAEYGPKINREIAEKIFDTSVANRCIFCVYKRGFCGARKDKCLDGIKQYLDSEDALKLESEEQPNDR